MSVNHLATFAEIDKNAETLSQWWTELLPELEKPGHPQFIRWARIHSATLEPMRYGMLCASRRLLYRPFNDREHAPQYISSRANDYRFRLQQLERAA